jgi:iron(II)-dependent oxidoreductase
MQLRDNDTGRLHTPEMRTAGKDLLSLALMDARNRSLRWAAVISESAELRQASGQPNDTEPQDGHAEASTTPFTIDEQLRRHLGQIGWYQEHWIARNVHRQRGERCDATAPKLASIDPMADRLWGERASEPATGESPPELLAVHQYLVDTLEVTLELLEGCDDSDDALYFYRLALLHEDRQAEAFTQMAQSLALRTPVEMVRPIAGASTRSPLMFPAASWTLGMSAGGFVFDNEKWAHEVQLAEFEIDAQPVSWGQYCDFIEDGGCDDARWWSAEGWRWVQRHGRRAPRHVDQMRHGVLQQRFGQQLRVPLSQPVLHVSWYEADAWCRWAGRRLPTEAEWEAAAHLAGPRGFRWGDAWEWTDSTLHPYPGFAPDPASTRTERAFGSHKVLRGGSFATAARMQHPKYRDFHLPGRDDIFSGFRSCSL